MNDQIKELTFSSITLGILIGIVMTAANVYLGLYVGITVSASIPAAVLAMGLYRGVIKGGSLHQSNIVQTLASAGESLAAGIIFTLPALVLVGAWKEFDFWATTFIAIAGGLLGVIFMIPLRKALIVEDKNLIYPEGVACAAVLETGSDKESKGFLVVIKGLALGSLFKFFTGGIGIFASAIEGATKIGRSAFFFGSDISPALLAVGYIIKLEVAVLIFIGGLIGWVIGIPFIGTPADLSHLSALDLSWTLWSTQVRYLGVGAMIVGGLWSIVSVRKGITAGLVGLKDAYSQKDQVVERANRDISLTAMLTLLGLCFVIMFSLYYRWLDTFGLTFITTVLMIFASFIFVAVSSYVVGLVGSSNNPVSGMTISALLVTAAFFLAIGFKGDSAILATLGVAAVVCCAACTAGDCSQDLKTGAIIKATPKGQQIAQVIGVIIPAFVIAPVLTLLHSAYGIGEGLKAPQATLFASLTKALFGNGTFPLNMVLLGGLLGVLVLIVDGVFLKDKKFRLHLMPMAVGIYLPVTLSVPIFIGGLIRYFVERKVSVDEGKDPGTLLSSGLIAGEAIMGVIIAIFLYFNMNLKIAGISHIITEVLGVLGFSYITYYLYKLVVKK